jgi:hypothetical protein
LCRKITSFLNGKLLEWNLCDRWLKWWDLGVEDPTYNILHIY